MLSQRLVDIFYHIFRHEIPEDIVMTHTSQDTLSSDATQQQTSSIVSSTSASTMPSRVALSPKSKKKQEALDRKVKHMLCYKNTSMYVHILTMHSIV